MHNISLTVSFFASNAACLLDHICFYLCLRVIILIIFIRKKNETGKMTEIYMYILLALFVHFSMHFTNVEKM